MQTPTSKEVTQAASVLNIARQDTLQAGEELDLALVELEKMPEWETWATAREALLVAKMAEKNATDQLKALAVKVHKVSGSKRFAGVSIRQMTRLHYSEETAKTHCIMNLPHALKLDKRTFEKVAKAMPLDFVTITQEPTAAIDRVIVIP